MKIAMFLIVAALVACSSKKEAKQRADFLAIAEMSDLVTVEYSLSKIVKANDAGPFFKIGSRKILLSINAYAKAGIDLSQITAENTKISGTSIVIKLPKAKIISLNIPLDEVVQEDEEKDFFRDRFSNEEKQNLLTQAEVSIRQTLDSIGILPKAEKNAEQFISNFAKSIGYTNVTFTYGDLPKKDNPRQ
jgi:hypothetical protein